MAVTCLLLAVTAAMVAYAQQGPRPQGVKGEMLMWIGDAEDKLEQLAAAMPEKAWSWRPAPGVRSTGELFMHVAAANYGIPTFWGVKPPAGFDFATYERSLTAKADVEKALADSFAHARRALEAASAEDLDKPAEFFGIKTTVRGGYMLVLVHVHEHLGQAIAYARTNGLTPPWSAKEQAAAQPEAKPTSGS